MDTVHYSKYITRHSGGGAPHLSSHSRLSEELRIGYQSQRFRNRRVWVWIGRLGSPFVLSRDLKKSNQKNRWECYLQNTEAADQVSRRLG